MNDVTILMPCLNEAETLGICIERAKKLLTDNNIDGEVLVSDNGSTDGSQDIARASGARVVNCPVRGYGAALQFGVENAAGEYILMGDSDDSYHFDEAWPMIQMLQKGYDVCMGTRLRGAIMKDAMPKLNRYVGNPVLSSVGKLFFKTSLSDFHCGLRAFRKDKLLMLNLATTGMEWASEMVVKARLAGLKMTEVPVTLYKDGRSRPPHLRRWRDGWRHLRFMLLHAPTWLFTFPGLAMVTVGILGQLLLYRGMVQVGTAKLDVHSMLVMSFLSVLGAQAVFTGLFARLYSSLHGILPYDEKFEKAIRRLTLEKLLIVSLILGLIGMGGFLSTIWEWYRVNFSELNYQVTMRRLIPSLTLVAFAVQGIFNGFMLSILFLKTSKSISMPE
jgi:glycosyltransferase involved in cell wall biosynthesis